MENTMQTIANNRMDESLASTIDKSLACLVRRLKNVCRTRSLDLFRSEIVALKLEESCLGKLLFNEKSVAYCVKKLHSVFLIRNGVCPDVVERIIQYGEYDVDTKLSSLVRILIGHSRGYGILSRKPDLPYELTDVIIRNEEDNFPARALNDIVERESNYTCSIRNEGMDNLLQIWLERDNRKKHLPKRRYIYFVDMVKELFTGDNILSTVKMNLSEFDKETMAILGI